MKKKWELKIEFIKKQPILSCFISLTKSFSITLLTFFLIYSSNVNAQVSSWRNGGLNSPMGGGPNRMMPPSGQNYSQWRNSRPTPNTPYYNNRPMVINRPVWVGGMYPWYNGFGYYNMYPYYWYDNQGYRNRATIRIYNDGKKDTVYTKHVKCNFGLLFSKNREIGGWLAIGNKNYFLVDFLQTSQKNSTTFFPNGHLNAVDFPLVNDWVRNTSIYVGLGQRHGKNGLHLSVGFVNENVRFQGKDSIGYITFPKSVNNFVTLKFGLLHDFANSGSLKLDYDPVRNMTQIGFGLHL